MDVRFLTAEQVAERYGLAPWTIREKTRNHKLPHIRHPGSKKHLYPRSWLDAFDEGATTLDVELGPDGGRVVRPRNCRRIAASANRKDAGAARIAVQ